MLTLTEEEHNRATEYVGEFAQHISADSHLHFDCVYRSHDFSDTRMVLRVKAAHQDFALKIDTASPETGRLQAEFELLTRLSAHFAKSERSKVVSPCFLSPGQSFFVTEFIDRPTSADVIHNSADDAKVAQIYRRAGAWLNDLHSVQPARDYGFRPRWMTDSIQELMLSVPPQVLSNAQPMVEALEKSALLLKGIPETQVFSHGDFHSQNLIVGQGEMIGLDFTEARQKLAVYDIVDFLKSDVFRDADPADIDRSGIIRTNKEMFFRQYRHPVQTEVLDFCIRARLLKDWLWLWQPGHRCSPYEEDRRHRLHQRLQIAFQSR